MSYHYYNDYYQNQYQQYHSKTPACLKRINREKKLDFDDGNNTNLTVYDRHIEFNTYRPLPSGQYDRQQQCYSSLPSMCKYAHFLFKIPFNYPFSPPYSVCINGHDYHKMLSEWSSKCGMSSVLCRKSKQMFTMLDLIHKVTGKECLCCSSLLCSNNWSPGNRLSQIVKEISRILELRHSLWEIKLAETIKSTYLVEDIPLIDYLLPRWR